MSFPQPSLFGESLACWTLKMKYIAASIKPNFEIVSIEEDSPAARAGLQVGDILLSSDGIAMENYKERDKRPREKVGQERTYVVERGGVEQTIVLTYAGLPQKNKTNRYISFVIGLLFILLPSVLTANNPSETQSTLRAFYDDLWLSISQRPIFHQ